MGKVKMDSCAIILAGGRSRRMGQDKACLMYEGMTFLEHTVVTMMTLTSCVIVVADQSNKYALPCGRVIADVYPDCGPVGGILTGLTQAGEGLHYVVACDMPLLNPAVLTLLMKADVAGIDAIVPEFGGQVHPLCGLYRHTAVPKLLKFLEEGGRSAQDALNILYTKKVGEGVLKRIDPCSRSLTNVNTPEEYEQFLQQNRGK